MKIWYANIKENILTCRNKNLRRSQIYNFDQELNKIKKYHIGNFRYMNLINDDELQLKKNIFNQKEINSFDFYRLTKYNKTSNPRVSNRLRNDVNLCNDKQNDLEHRISGKLYHSIIKKGLKEKKIKKQIILKKKNLYNLFQTISNMKIIKIFLILTILYVIIFKVRLLRFTLSRIFYRISSEPKSILYELYFGSNLNLYVKKIITEVMHDEEIQLKATKYLIELLEEESFINSIAKFTNHLLVKILSEERLLDTFSNRLLIILKSEKMDKEIKKFLEDTIKRDEFRNNIMKLIGFYTFRKESNDAIKQLIEYGFRQIKYDHDLNPNLTEMLIELLISNYMRKKFLNHFNQHFLNDYPNEKSMKNVLDIIKEEEYIFPKDNIQSYHSIYNDGNKNEKNNDSSKKDSGLLEKKFASNKQKYEMLYKNNNCYIDGYLSKDNPKKTRENVIELGKIFNNLIFTDVEYHPHLGTFSNFASYLDEDYFKLMMDKQLLRNNVFLQIHKTENVYLNKLINNNQLHKELSLSKVKSEDEHKKDKEIDLNDYQLNMNFDFYDFLDKHKLGQFKYNESLGENNDLQKKRVSDFDFRLYKLSSSFSKSSVIKKYLNDKKSKEYLFPNEENFVPYPVIFNKKNAEEL